MENFTAFNPTKLFFGKDILLKLNKNIVMFGKKALLVYGKNSAKKYGYYNQVLEQLKLAAVLFVEYEGIKPNPIIDDVEKAVELCKKENIDFIIALGGGSVIDSAKIISLAYTNNVNAWDIMKYRVKTDKNIPIIAILTYTATGTEMNGAAVIQNHQTHEKLGYFNELIYPTQSYLDPSVTFSLSKEQTVYGIVDMMAHTLEAFFAGGKAEMSDQFVGAFFREIFEVTPKLLKNLTNYDYRARIMWASTVALNGTMSHGRSSSGDWGVHSFAHVLSYLFDSSHGATLSVIYPAWLKHFRGKLSERIEKLGYLITNEEISADETIKLLENFFIKIGAPVTADELEICRNDFNSIKKYLIHTKVSGMNYVLTEDDYDEILKLI